LIYSDIHENSLAVLAAVKFGNEWIGQRQCDREVQGAIASESKRWGGESALLLPVFSVKLRRK